LVKDLQLDGAGTGDRLVFLDAGAYAVSEGMALFLSHELPEVFLYDEESGRLRQLRKQVETWQLNTEGGSNG
jgi:diaminopimelate decarboxylase